VSQHYPKAYTKYGASMGRDSDRPSDFDLMHRLSCRRVPISRDGYDPGGAYWGTGTPLWRVEDSEGHTHYTRGATLADVHAKFPGAKWFRQPRR
jgi:hypothetical protein